MLTKSRQAKWQEIFGINPPLPQKRQGLILKVTQNDRNFAELIHLYLKAGKVYSLRSEFQYIIYRW